VPLESAKAALLAYVRIGAKYNFGQTDMRYYGLDLVRISDITVRILKTTIKEKWTDQEIDFSMVHVV
jgi:hypothetical protein